MNVYIVMEYPEGDEPNIVGLYTNIDTARQVAEGLAEYAGLTYDEDTSSWVGPEEYTMLEVIEREVDESSPVH